MGFGAPLAFLPEGVALAPASFPAAAAAGRSSAGLAAAAFVAVAASASLVAARIGLPLALAALVLPCRAAADRDRRPVPHSHETTDWRMVVRPLASGAIGMLSMLAVLKSVFQP